MRTRALNVLDTAQNGLLKPARRAAIDSKKVRVCLTPRARSATLPAGRTKEERVVTPCLGLERRDFQNTRPIGKKPPNLMSSVGGWEQTAQPEERQQLQATLEAGASEAQPDPLFWGRRDAG